MKTKMQDFMSHLLKTNEQLSGQDSLSIIEYMTSNFSKLMVAFSGAEDVVLVDMVMQVRPDIAICTLDTGRLHPKTYAYLEEVRVFYNKDIHILSPDTHELEDFVLKKGLFSFYKDGHGECCAIRKVNPLRKALAHYDAWLTGQRRVHNESRENMRVIEYDVVFSTRGHPIVKCNPLADWRSEEMFAYIKKHALPYNPLFAEGYKSIGCQPCSRPIGPDASERAGRWWWEEPDQKECGLHQLFKKP